MSVLEYAKILAATLALEFPLYWLFFRSMGWKKVVALTFVVNLASHPLVTFAWPLLIQKMGWSFGHFILAAELFAPIVETLIIRYGWKISWKRSILAAFVANLLSWTMGSYFF